jgi:hypothetical protein
MKGSTVRKMVDDALDNLADELSKGKSEKLQAYLKMMGRFHHYSLGNQILIALQQPDSTSAMSCNDIRVNGF